MAVEAFGGDRLMWGSDFPPSANREGYRNALRFPMELIDYPSTEALGYGVRRHRGQISGSSANPRPSFRRKPESIWLLWTPASAGMTD